MPTLKNSEVYTARGEIDVSNGTLTLKDDQIARAKLTREDLAEVAIPLHQARVHDNLTALLPQTAATDDLAFIEGTWTSDAPTIQTSDADNTTVTQKCRFIIPITNDYIEGETITVRVRAGMLTTIASASATLDLEAYVWDGDGSVGSDLGVDGAKDINSLTIAAKDFPINATSIVHGDVLDMVLTIAITDASAGSANTGVISKVAILRDIRG